VCEVLRLLGRKEGGLCGGCLHMDTMQVRQCAGYIGSCMQTGTLNMQGTNLQSTLALVPAAAVAG
jgi:hypothetical protein